MPWPDRQLMLTVASIDSRLSAIEASQYVGVAYNTATDTWIRLGCAQGFSVGSFLGAWISPIFSRLRRVTLTDAGVVVKEVSFLDKTKYTDGTAVPLGGADGQIMVEYLPGYCKYGVIGSWYYMLISHLLLPGFSLHPVFTGYSAVYAGAYEASLYSSKLWSVSKSPVDGVSDVYPVTDRTGTWGYTGLTASGFDTLAQARGTGWMSDGFLLRDWCKILGLVQFASYDIPAIVGQGRINLSGGTWTNGSYIGKCGLSDSVAGFNGAVQNGTTAGYATDFSLCLLQENAWGNVWERVPALISERALYYKSTPPFDYTTITGWTRLQDALGVSITLPTTDGYGGKPFSGLGIVLPSDVTGSSSTKMRDYYSQATGLRVLLVGGTSYDGASAGPFYWYAYNAASGTGTSLGGRLCFKKDA